MNSNFYASQMGFFPKQGTYGAVDAFDQWVAEEEAGQSLPPIDGGGEPEIDWEVDPAGAVSATEVVIGPHSNKEAIQNWQRYLARKGQSLGHWCVDGDWGNSQNSFTRKGTRAVAALHGVSTPDGVVTKELWDKVFTEYRTLVQNKSNPSLSSTERSAACPAAPQRSTPQTVAQGSASDDYSTPGASLAGAFTGRNIALVGGVALLGIGLFAMMRRQGGQSAIEGEGFRVWEDIEVY